MSTFAYCIYTKDAALHRAVKVAAVRAGITMSEFAENALRRELERAEVRPGGYVEAFDRRAEFPLSTRKQQKEVAR